MELIQAIILGLLQGLTEWLPISSSGHLVLAQKIMNLAIPFGFYAMLHLGTLLAVVIFFLRDVIKILKSILHLRTKDEEFKIFKNVIIGITPISIVGIIFLKFFESLFTNLTAVGIGLLITGVFLLLSKFKKGNKKINWQNSLLIGISQAISIVPGISRSGVTISTGLLNGIKKEEIFRYSFLLSIPVMIGWSLLEYNWFMISDLSTYSVIGFVIAAMSGYFAIRFVRKMVLSEKFYLFAVYCFILGIIVITILK